MRLSRWIAVCLTVAAISEVGARAQQIAESFDGAFPPPGWIIRNQSDTADGNCWVQGDTGFGWPPRSGPGQAIADAFCTVGVPPLNDISGWLIGPELSDLQDGDVLSFWTRTWSFGAADQIPDRLEVRLCLDAGTGSCGASGSTGATASSVGGFDTLLFSVNPTLSVDGYPQTYARFAATISGLGPGSHSGRIAFRYFVPDGGLAGDNSFEIGLDDVLLTGTLMAESFDDAFPPTGWIRRNQSSTADTDCWFQRATDGFWPTVSGAAQASADFDCVTGGGTISGWLISPDVLHLRDGAQLSFWTRKGYPDYRADRLEVRFCRDGSADSCGALDSSGSTATDVGSFTSLLGSINPTLVLDVYPTPDYAFYTFTLSGLPGESSGRFAFRYFVPFGGPDGPNSQAIALDDVAVAQARMLRDGFENGSFLAWSAKH